MGQGSPFLSTDPNAAQPAKAGASPFLSTDPHATDAPLPVFRSSTADPVAQDALLNQFGLRGAAFGLDDPLTDAVKGVVKGALDTASTLGHFLRMIPGVNALDKLMPPIPVNVTPTNRAQSIGKGLERIGEVLIPSGGITRAGTATAVRLAPRLAPLVGETAARVIPRAVVEGAASGAIGAAQGGDPVTAAALGAVIPGALAVGERFVPALRAAAQTKVVQALGPTKERFKAMAAKIAPDVVARGLRGSREALKGRAAGMVDEFGQQIDAAIQQYGERRVGTQPIVDALESAKAKFQRVRPMTIAQAMREGFAELVDGGHAVLKKGATMNGETVMAPVVFDQRPIRQLSQLQGIVKELGEDATAEHLVALRRAWDDVVAQAGGYAQRAAGAIGVPLKDQSEAWAKKKATTAIREVLAAEVPELTALNKEFSFWKSLDDVLGQTLKRTAPQRPGLGGQVAEVTGAVMGGHSGVGVAFVTAKLAKMANSVFTSPRWRMVDAQMRNQLADAIVSGNAQRLTSTLGRIAAVQGSKLPATAAAR